MITDIESTLNQLVGKPLISLGRAGNLIWFFFGKYIINKNKIGIERKVGEYVLHVQCSWRLVNENKILVGSKDIYMPHSQHKGEGEEFDWDIEGMNRFDEQAKALNEYCKARLFVEQIQADSLGGVKIYFKNNHVLELFPDDSSNDEFWRFFSYIDNSPHLVVTGKGIEN